MQKLNNKCDAELKHVQDEFMIGGNFDAHYSKSRIEYANCLDDAK